MNTVKTSIRRSKNAEIYHYAHRNEIGQIVAACGAKTGDKPELETSETGFANCHRCIGINSRSNFRHLNNI